MRERLVKFLKILVVELEDMEADIKTMEDLYEYKYQQKEITDYVHLENIAILKREYSGIMKLCAFVRDLVESPDDFNDVDSLVNYLKMTFRQRIKEAGYPDVVFLLINRKIEKVMAYMA